MKKHFFTILISASCLFADENLLKKSIEFLQMSDIENTKKYLYTITQKEYQNQKEYWKAFYIVSAFERNGVQSRIFFEKIESYNYLDDFILYLRILELLDNNDFLNLKKYLFKFNLTKKWDSFYSIGYFSCPDSFPYYWDTLTPKQKLNLWRDLLTLEEANFILWIRNFFDKSASRDGLVEQVRKCIKESRKNPQIVYKYYRLLNLIDENNDFTFDFYLFLKKQKKYLESLHLLRKLYYSEKYSLKDKEYFLIFFEFKQIYRILGYSSQSLVIDRFLGALKDSYIKNQIDWDELRKIATENLKQRELLFFMALYSNQKEFYYKKIEFYDNEFNMKEKIFFYKEIYPY